MRYVSKEESCKEKQYYNLLSDILTSSYSSTMGNESNDGYASLTYLGEWENVFKVLKTSTTYYKTLGSSKDIYYTFNWNAGGALQDVVRTLYGFYKAVKQVWG